MAEKKKQFDEFLGGSESLPHEVSIMQFVSSRAREISAMTASIENPKQSKLIFQKLPVYMRRRVMSHNVKRLPRRLREAHSAQMAKSANGQNSSSTNKRPSRKYRRRPRILLSEYSRRQCNKKWLETHIWHAKRFHMINKWGYRLANYSNDKCFRANYRAITQHCLLQDISYYTCVEIVGEENLLKTTLKKHCNTSTLTFAAKIYTNGNREGTVMFFKKDSYPYFPVGNVKFFWKPKESDIRTIWIWVHPAFYTTFLSEIISSFEFKQNNTQNPTDVTYNVNYLYTNDTGCKMIVLRNAFNRFRLHGPTALNVLREVLQIPSLTELDVDPKMNYTITEEQDSSLSDEKLDANKISIDNNDSTQSVERIAVDGSEENITNSKDLSIEDLKKKLWHTKYYKTKENIEAFKIQQQLWQSINSFGSPNLLPTNMILGLTVLDPRFYLPEKRTKTEECKMKTSQLKSIYQLPINSNCSPIWDAQIRHIVSNSCVSTSTINKLRSKCLVPGISNDQYFNKDIMAKIPIVLIQKPGNITGLGSSIDIIIPSGWAMSFWLTFIMRCARVGALRESRMIAFESLQLNVPDINDPNSSAYMKEALDIKEELTCRYFCYPPNRRINFVKFGIRSPFFCDWKNLTKDWSDVEDFYVLRNRELLSLLQAGLHPVKNAKSKSTEQNTQFNFQDFDECKNCLVHVQLSLVGKGTPKKFAIVCMPTQEDMKKFENNKKWAGPVEKCHTDPNEKSRKELRKNHQALLKRLRRQRVQRKKTFQNNALLKKSVRNSMEHASSLVHRKIISDHSEKMSKLYLPESTEVRHSCDREVMGYITIGEYSFSKAKGIGIGYVTLSSLLEIVRKKFNTVLVRNTQTRQYRLAKLEILGL